MSPDVVFVEVTVPSVARSAQREQGGVHHRVAGCCTVDTLTAASPLGSHHSLFLEKVQVVEGLGLGHVKVIGELAS